MKKNRLIATAGVALAASIALTGCSFDAGATTSDSDTPTVVNQIGWGGTTWTQNFNLFSPTGVAVTPGTAYVYEPLIRMNRVSAGEIMPHLATEWGFNEDGTELTFTLRDDVTWADGEPFTAADVAFTWNLVLAGETPQAYPFTSVEATDEHTVTVTYDKQSFADLASFATRQIVPEHIWSEQNVREWTNPEPIGTGPAVLDKFSPQQISFTLRDDYWGGESAGVETLNMHAVTGDARMSQLISGQMDFGTFGWSNADEEFIAKDPENNLYGFYPTGTSDGLIFNTEVAPYDDPHVRRALRAALDLQIGAEIAAVGYDVPTQAGVSDVVYADQLAEGTEQKQDVDAALAELEDGGWSVEDGKLVKDGESFELRYDVYQPYEEWVRTGTIMADQWRENLGLDVAVNQMADAPFTEASSTGQFGMLSGSPIFGSTPYVAYSSMTALAYKPIGEAAVYNQGRWQNAEFDAVVAELGAIAPGSDAARAAELSAQAQQIMADEAPFIATATAGWKAVANQTRWTGFPVPGEDDYAPNPTLPADAILTIMNLEPRG
ncbi:ABC transporter substrate-binding protein [Microbacterium esteraromaticum]|uniref:ABC transporter substrate-binding protein n=1 Tax=Microbacterium esteraromaticum TaxID=57043 RepID=UPI001CD4BA4F|nr:ABC transporter substrate-binding protein [Microbacterium esteraromaticum]MCA1305280.1 ABC transporter substrate-binding protein [Microbacterium esteraromaticum]